MRTRFLSLGLSGAFAALAAFTIGCEDGPAQTFDPAPPGAAGYWNNGNTDAAVFNGTASFDASYPTVNQVTLCSTDFRRQRWSWMLTQPIAPPRKYAGIDLARDDQWDGLTIEEAENPPSNPTSPEGGLCQSTPLGFEGTCPSGIGGCDNNYWGENQEVAFSWNVATHILDQMVLSLGYTGSLKTDPYPDDKGEVHSYALTIADVYRRDGKAFEINWPSKSDREEKITNIFNAVMATYASSAGIPFDTSDCTDDTQCAAPGTVSSCQCLHGSSGTACASGQKGKCGVTNCGADGNCLISADNGGQTVFGIRPMVVYMQGNAGVPQPALSTPTQIFNYFTKWEPYSNLNQVVKLDADGPIAQGTPVGAKADAGTVCTQKIGQTFSNLTSDCVAVSGTGVNTVNVNKITHGLSHDQEHWTANVLGVNQNFTSSSVASNPNIVVLDTDTPQPSDVTQDWEFDLRARGYLANDYNAAGILEQRGSSLMMIEWARLLLEDIAKQLSAQQGRTIAPKKLGDPACVGFTGTVPNYVATNANPATFGCSGVEGLIIPSGIPYGATGDFSLDPGLQTADPNANLNPTSNWDEIGFYQSVLKPGDLYGGLCIDGAAATDCIASLSIWTNMLTQVTRVLGNGNVASLPSEMQDRRYYFKWFGLAFVRYLKAYGNYATAHPSTVNDFPDGTPGGGLGPSDVVATTIDNESIFFDYEVSQNIGGGGAETYDKFEYVDRTTIGTGAGGANNVIPWDFQYGSDLLGGNQRYDNWYRRMDREEIGMYSAMLEDKTKTPGAENNVNITNLFGSGLLGGKPAAGVPGAWSSFACATGTAGDPQTNGCGTNPPLDPTLPGMPACSTAGTCTGSRVCISAPSYENGTVQACALPCDFAANPTTGCASSGQVCVANGKTEGCMPAMMDKNAGQSNAQPLLAHYPGAWSRTPFSAGHSPITLAPSDKHPEIGVAHVTVPNFLGGPYANSPASPTTGSDGGLVCPSGWAGQADGLCAAPLQKGNGATAPFFNPLTPWSEVQPGVGFTIPITGTRSQYVSTGQFDYTGVLESYIVDYLPWTDSLTPGCVAANDAATACNPGYTCDPVSKNCIDSDNSVQIAAIEGTDFLGQAFLCQDPTTGDVLHVGMYDSALSIIDWLAAHPGNTNPNAATGASAQSVCQIIVIRSPANNYIDQIASLANGVVLNISGGQGLGRVTDIVLFDPGLIQAL